MLIRATKDNITTLQVDAIVNAANSSLLGGGGGVDGAIHRAAGPELVAECRMLNGCNPGEAKITKGYRLPAKFVIHTVGPIWQGGGANEAETLAACYRNSLHLAVAHDVTSIAFPAISTGIYGYPKEDAAGVALAAVTKFAETPSLLSELIFCCFDAETLEIYRKLLDGR